MTPGSTGAPPPQNPWTIRSLLAWTAEFFGQRGLESPRLDAEVLLAHSLGYSRLDLYTRHDQPLNPEELAGFRALVKRRANREPAAYITGVREFWSLELEVNPDVLIPRPDTETLVEAALEILAPDAAGKRVLDLGTGSGAIILALAKERPGNYFAAVDASPNALETARKNAETHGLHVDFFPGSWFEPVHCLERFDVIVSNPPYIPTAEIPKIQPEVANFEPLSALDGGPEGMDALFWILSRAPGYLQPGGWLCLEMGCDQRSPVKEAAAQVGAYTGIRFKKDLAGLDRAAVMQRNE